MGGRRRGARQRHVRLLLLLVLGAMLTGRAAVAADPDAPSNAPSAATGQEQSEQPVRQYVDSQGRLCRVYVRQIVIDGTSQTAYATLCRDPDGRWVIAR